LMNEKWLFLEFEWNFVFCVSETKLFFFFFDLSITKSFVDSLSETGSNLKPIAHEGQKSNEFGWNVLWVFVHFFFQGQRPVGEHDPQPSAPLPPLALIINRNLFGCSPLAQLHLVAKKTLYRIRNLMS
jgi:hypothetical protein